MDLETFISQIDRSEFDREIDRELFVEAHALLNAPPLMHSTIVSHLTMMWHEALAEEWERNEASLKQIVHSLRTHARGSQNGYEAVRKVTGRDIQGCWQDVLAPAETLIFIASPHSGPYLLHYAYPPVVRVIFAAQPATEMREGQQELERADLLVQLRALADDTRLRILELLFAEGELDAQEILARLGLTKSSGSRHLSKLSAAGYLVEHQKGKAKGYALNPERFREVWGFLEQYGRSVED
jgi:DNA-binding transcriptional ArsR family regulator